MPYYQVTCCMFMQYAYLYSTLYCRSSCSIKLRRTLTIRGERCICSQCARCSIPNRWMWRKTAQLLAPFLFHSLPRPLYAHKLCKHSLSFLYEMPKATRFRAERLDQLYSSDCKTIGYLFYMFRYSSIK